MGVSGFQKVVSDVSNSLQGILKRANLIDGYLDRVVYPTYQNIQRERWASENASQGSAWPALSAQYAGQKVKKYASFPGGGTKMMIATKRLFNSVVGDTLDEHRKIISDHQLQIYTTVPYAPYANQARQFTTFSEDEIRKIKSDIVNYLSGSDE